MKDNTKQTWSRWRWFASVLFAGCCVLFATSCNNQAPGIAPDPNNIHYPVGVAVHPSGKFLYVTNSNFDLAYTGGTVMVFSTEETKTVVVDRAGIKTELKTLEQLKGSTVSIGSFAGQIILNRAGTKAYVAVRQDRKTDSPIDLSAILTLSIDANKTGKGHLNCDQVEVKKEQTGGVGEEDKFEKEPPPKCGDTSKIFLGNNPYPYSIALLSSCQAQRRCSRDSDCNSVGGRCDHSRCVPQCSTSPNSCKAGQTCKAGRCSCKRQLDCPSGEVCVSGSCRTPLSATQRFCTQNSDCQSFETCRGKRLLATHIENGGLSEYPLPLLDKEKKTCKSSTDCTGTGEICTSGRCQQALPVRSIPSIPKGITAMAILPNNNLLGTSGNIFLTSNQDGNIYVLPSQLPPANNTLSRIPFTNTSGTTSTAADLRGVAVGYDKKNNTVRLFVASRRPTSAVLVYRLSTNASGAITATLQRFVPVGNGPAHLLYHPRPAPSPDLLYVVCSRDGRVDVINTETLQIIHQIKVGEQPAFIALYEPTAGSSIKRRRAYVANFLDTSISIIDLKNHQVIGQVIGINTRLPLP